jgi:hypothetical protein
MAQGAGEAMTKWLIGGYSTAESQTKEPQMPESS